MTSIRPLLFAAVALFALSGCVTPEEPIPESSAPEAGIPPKPPVSVPPPANPGEPAMTCHETGTEWAIGKLADEALVTRVRTETHSKGVRVIKPGMAVTMDYREDRVNIDVDANNRVTKIRCG